MVWKVNPPQGLFKKYQILEVDNNDKFLRVVAELPEGTTEQCANFIASAPTMWDALCAMQDEGSAKLSIDKHEQNTETLIKILDDLTILLNNIWDRIV